MRVLRLTPFHAAEYRALMLHAYESEPEAFTSTVAEREPLPLSWWESRVSDEPDPEQLVLGAYVDAELAGVAGLHFEGRLRTQHKATLFGMYVRPRFRNLGIGRALVAAVLEQARARSGVEIVLLTVSESNRAALRLYESSGFKPIGTEPFANKIGDRYVSVVHMWRRARPGRP